MSGFSKNHIPRRIHKERSQLSSRVSKHGLLEKKKDYKLRAKDANRKAARLRLLKEKARFRNPEEFYHSMIRQKTENGVVQRKLKNHLKPIDHRKSGRRLLAESQDLNYVKYKLSIERNIVERLKKSLTLNNNNNNNNSDVKHILFVEDEDEQDQVINDKKQEQKQSNYRFHSNKLAKKFQRRQERQDMLSTVYNDISNQKHLLSKGTRFLVKPSDKKAGTPPVYRWLQERKR